MKRVVIALTLMAENYETTISPELLKLWLKMLEGYDPAVTEQAVLNVMRKHGHESVQFRSMPPFALLQRELDLLTGSTVAGDTVALQAQAEWGRLLKEIGRVGSWGTPNLHPTTSCVVRFLGGWTQVCLWQEKDLQWHQRRFLDAWIQTHGREEVLELGAEAVKQLAAPKPTGGMKSLSSMIASRRLEARENA